MLRGQQFGGKFLAGMTPLPIPSLSSYLLEPQEVGGTGAVVAFSSPDSFTSTLSNDCLSLYIPASSRLSHSKHDKMGIICNRDLTNVDCSLMIASWLLHVTLL